MLVSPSETTMKPVLCKCQCRCHHSEDVIIESLLGVLKGVLCLHCEHHVEHCTRASCTCWETRNPSSSLASMQEFGPVAFKTHSNKHWLISRHQSLTRLCSSCQATCIFQCRAQILHVCLDVLLPRDNGIHLGSHVLECRLLTLD